MSTALRNARREGTDRPGLSLLGIPRGRQDDRARGPRHGANCERGPAIPATSDRLRAINPRLGHRRHRGDAAPLPGRAGAPSSRELRSGRPRPLQGVVLDEITASRAGLEALLKIVESRHAATWSSSSQDESTRFPPPSFSRCKEFNSGGCPTRPRRLHADDHRAERSFRRAKSPAAHRPRRRGERARLGRHARPAHRHLSAPEQHSHEGNHGEPPGRV